jgi:hypothetical protein
MRLELGSAVFTTFFYSLRSESKRIWILLLHICMFGYICTHHLFASFASYSHRFSYKYQFDAKTTCGSEYSLQSKYLLKIFSCWRIFASKY